MTGIDYSRLYEYRLRGTDQQTRQAVWTEIATYLDRRMGEPGRVLDVGAMVSNVLEHLPTREAVGAALARLRDAMAPGGTVAVIGPNFRYCAREYFDCADHVLALTHIAVAGHLHAAGFSISTAIPRFLPYSFRGKLPASPALTCAYPRHPALWRLIGKQFLVLRTR